MIKIKVRAPYYGKVAIRDKYVKQARETNQDIQITCEGASMVIPVENIERRCTGRSGVPVKDKFSGKSHWLIYFNWKPEKSNQQQSLL